MKVTVSGYKILHEEVLRLLWRFQDLEDARVVANHTSWMLLRADNLERWIESEDFKRLSLKEKVKELDAIKQEFLETDVEFEYSPYDNNDSRYIKGYSDREEREQQRREYEKTRDFELNKLNEIEEKKKADEEKKKAEEEAKRLKEEQEAREAFENEKKLMPEGIRLIRKQE